MPVLAAAGDAGLGDLVQGGEPVGLDGAEHGVLRRQLGVLVDHEELAAVGAGPGVGHGQGAARVEDGLLRLGVVRRVLVGGVFVGELVARAARAFALGVAALQDAQPR